MAADEPQEGGSATYQGLPVMAANMSLSPGLSPDQGSVRILVSRPDKIKLKVSRPMFPNDGESPKAKFQLIDGKIIDGNSLELWERGDLVLTSATGSITYKNVYVADEGVVEEDALWLDDGVTRVSIVSIALVDDRVWWGKRGFVFGCFNKLGVDGKHIQVTGKPPDGAQYTLEEMLHLATEMLCSRPAFGGVFSDLDAAQYPPTDLEPRFTPPADFLAQIIEPVRLLPCRNLDNTLSFYSPGKGASPTSEFFPRAAIMLDRIRLGHNYNPDVTLLFAQYPTTREDVIEFDGRTQMRLPDPRTGEFKFYKEMLPFYGVTEDQFAQIPCVHDANRVDMCIRFVRAYLPHLASGDFIPNPGGNQPGNLLLKEAIRRGNLLAEHAFRVFQVPDADLAKLPFEEALLSTDKRGTTGQGMPSPIVCRVNTFRFADSRDPADQFGVSHRGWVNPKDPLELYQDDGSFSVQSRTGMLFFHDRFVGKVYQGSGSSRRYFPADVPTAPATDEMGQPLEMLKVEPPSYIYLKVAHTLRGTRDLRASPGRRSKFPDKVAKIQLQERASPEDHYLAAFDVNGAPIDVDEADSHFPEVRMMRGMRELLPLDETQFTVARTPEALADRAKKQMKPLLAALPTERGRRIRANGIFNIPIDGVVTQVQWSVDENRVATTEILVGCLRTSLGGNIQAFAEKQAAMNATAPPSGASSKTNVMPQ